MAPSPPGPLRAAALAALLLAGAGCSPPPPATAAERQVAAYLGESARAWAEAEGEARAALAAGAWDRAAAAWERRIALYPSSKPGEPRPGIADAAVRIDLYNLACARSRGGRREAALDALEQAAAEGAGFVGHDHLASDPDLRPLHGEPRWEALLRRLSWNDAVAVLDGGGAAGPRPLVVRIGGAEEAAAGTVTAIPLAPYLLSPGEFAWTTRLDRGERAAEKVAFAAGEAGRRASLDGRRVLLAEGAGAAAVAWEVLLRRPELFTAAVMAGPAPPAWDLLDRGAERVRTRILVVGEGAAPDGAVPVKTERAAGVEAALREALR